VLPYSALTIPQGLAAMLAFIPRFVRELLMFRRRVSRGRPDLVVVVTAMLPTALLGARLGGAPTLVYAAEILERSFKRDPGRALFGRFVLRMTKSSSTAIVATSRAVAAQYDEADPRVSVVYPGVSPMAPGDGDGFRRKMGLELAEPCIAVLGNITFGRGQDLAIRAVALLVREFPHIGCIIAGGTLGRPLDEAYLASLHELAISVGVSERVAFVGFVDNVADVYAATDIVVNPARVPEGLGLVALEALTAGRPVVSARVGAVPEVLRDGQDALLVEPDSSAALASAISRLWWDDELRRTIIERGRERALRVFGEDQGTEAFSRVLAGALASRDGGRAGRIE
jgi:glycosyltransferase involved in cell wall biosynthesis